MACAEYETLIEKHKAGTLTEGEKAKLEQHIKECFDCRAARDGGILPERRRTRERVKKNKIKSLPVFIAALLILAVAVVVVLALRKTGRNPAKPGHGNAGQKTSKLGRVLESLRVPGAKKDDLIRLGKPGYNIPEDGQLIFELVDGSRITCYRNSGILFDESEGKIVGGVTAGRCEFNFAGPGRVVVAGALLKSPGAAAFQVVCADKITVRVMRGIVKVTSGGETLEAPKGNTVTFERGKPPVEFKKKPPGE